MLKKVELRNYRQFEDGAAVFSTKKNQPFTIIEGRNGFGKSNILNAITWCFYGIEQHLKNTNDEVFAMIYSGGICLVAGMVLYAYKIVFTKINQMM